MKVLICDDLSDRGTDVANKIEAGGQAKPDVLVGEQLLAELKGLFTRVRDCMEDAVVYAHAGSRFDEADLVVLDNNLAYLPNNQGPPLTAESIAGYLRAFTKCKYIVSLNMNPDVDFDLRYLVGDFSSRADLALNSDHLSNPGLWSGNPLHATDSFRPWYWPRLDAVAERREKQVGFVSQNLTEPVLGSLGFDSDAIDLLSLHARGALSPEASPSQVAGGEGIPLQEVTFLRLFESKDRSIPFKEDRIKLAHASMGGNADLLALISRVVAADLDLWFRRDVIGPQEPLVDLPHLLLRLPFMLGGRAGELGAWNEAVLMEGPPFGLEQHLYDTYFAPVKFGHDFWSPTPSFWWSRLKANDELNDLYLRGGTEWADVVFCEDCSQFLLTSGDGAAQPPREFSAEFEGAWSRRYVSDLAGIQYAPRTRLST